MLCGGCEWVEPARRRRWALPATILFHCVLAFAPLDLDPARYGSNRALRLSAARVQVEPPSLLLGTAPPQLVAAVVAEAPIDLDLELRGLRVQQQMSIRILWIYKGLYNLKLRPSQARSDLVGLAHPNSDDVMNDAPFRRCVERKDKRLRSIQQKLGFDSDQGLDREFVDVVVGSGGGGPPLPSSS
jgi:hypothetical protein